MSWPRTARRAALPALLLGALLLALLAAPGVSIPGQRGASALAEGFRPGRWDARFVVARGPAALVLPPLPLRVVARLSGPAGLTLKSGAQESRVSLTADPSPVEVSLAAGGRVELVADATLRLHELELERLGGPPWRRLLFVAAAMLLAAGLAARWRGGIALLASCALTLGVGALALQGSFARLVAAALARRAAPAALLTLVCASFLLLRLARPPRAAAAPRTDARLPLAFGALLLGSCLLQLFLFPQPLVIGDPAAYHDIGGRFRDALLAVRSLDGLGDALQELRPYGGLAFTGLVYGLLRALFDRLLTIYVVQALAMAGCAFFLVRAAERLGGRRLALTTGLLALSYGTFPVLVGLVQPEPFLLLLWTFALDALLGAAERDDERAAAWAGVAFAVGLALHPQGIWFLLLALAIVLLPFAGALWAPARRRLLRGFAIGLMPVALVTAAGEAYARPVTPVLDERHGFWAYTAPFPLGFWLFLDTDGWQGPERIDDTRYGRALREAEQAGAVHGSIGRLAFTARFVASNAADSLRTVLRNLYRLYELPDNPPRLSYPLPYALQLPWHRALVTLALLGVAVALPGRAALGYVPFAMLALTYPLYHIFNKYQVPATPFLLLGAALALERLAEERRPALLGWLLVAGLGATLPPAALAFLDVPVAAAHAIVRTLHLGGLAVAFFIVGRGWARGALARAALAVALLVLVVPSLAADWNDPDWRSFHVALDRPAEHEIRLRPADIAGLDAAREAYLLLDLWLPDGDPAALELRFEGGLTLPGRELEPAMPSFGLATTRFHRDPRAFRQWWRVAWQPAMARDGRLRLTLRGPRGAWCYGALGDPGATLVNGLSLGQWPYLSVYRLMHDGEYRLAVEQPLAGLGRMSMHAGAELPGLLGVRVVRLAEATSLARVATATVPAAARAIVTAVWARASSSGSVDLELPGGSLRFPLGVRGRLAGPPGPDPAAVEVRFVPTGDDEGWFLVRTPAPRGEPLELTFRPRQELMSPPRAFEPVLHSETPPVPLDWTGFPYVPVTKILESRVEPWRPEAVY